jgi:hypothetical protein
VIVLDASVLANLVGDDGPDGRAGRSALAAAREASIPDLADIETLARAPGLRCSVLVLSPSP